MKFSIVYFEAAKEDIMDLTDFISIICKAPNTSKEFMKGLFNRIKDLEHSADSYLHYYRKSFMQYGFNVHRINHKKMAIIYTIHGDIVLVQRVISSGLVLDVE